MPRKVFVAGEILTAADVNTNLMDQAVMVFDDSTARGSAIPSPSEGMVTYLKDLNQVQAYDGSAFKPIGGVLQVVSTNKTDIFTTTSGSYVDVTGLTVSITPSSTQNKILVFLNVQLASSATSIATPSVEVQLLRDATALQNTTDGHLFATATNASRYRFGFGATILDSPASTSALDYQVQIKSNSGTAYLNSDGAGRSTEVSSLTVMEVAG